MPNTDNVADIFNYYHQDPNALKIDGQWCYKRIHEKQFTWPVITKKMLRIVNDVLNEKQNKPTFKGFVAPVKVGRIQL